jgi:hypothetical protein
LHAAIATARQPQRINAGSGQRPGEIGGALGHGARLISLPGSKMSSLDEVKTPVAQQSHSRLQIGGFEHAGRSNDGDAGIRS